jgi:hypothetical protein
MRRNGVEMELLLLQLSKGITKSYVYPFFYFDSIWLECCHMEPFY